MHLSKKGEYALRGMIDLAIAHAVGRGLVQTAEIAAKERISVKFLEGIFGELRIAGYLQSRRGKQGGYQLARHPREIAVGEIVRLVDGPLAPIACVSQTAYCPCTCPDEEHCGLRMLMMDVRNAISRIVDRYTLADVAEVTLRKLRRDGLPLPFQPPAAPVPPPATVPASRTTTPSPSRRSRDGFEENLTPDYAI
jgi:Rrf2 family protein